MNESLHTILGVIPARLGSTRFPAKVLANRTGKTLIQHVWENARRASTLSRVVIATDDLRVRDACIAFGAEVVMTRTDHANGTSRIAEAAGLLGLSPDAIVVNVQGDEPELEPQAIDDAARACANFGADVATIASPFAPGEDPEDPNIVKVVTSQTGMALYFSRALIPFPRNRVPQGAAPMRHVGLYAYRASFLARYASLAPTPLEQSESLEQLRVLEHGYRIAVTVRQCRGGGIDTPEQYEAFVRRVRGGATRA